MVPLDRALVSFYRLSIVTASYSDLAAICNGSIWGCSHYPRLGGMWCCRGLNWYCRVAVGQTDRQTDTTS